MKHIDIRRIDLNLLIAFEAIYQEGSVTGASERLYLTQSALSHALSRLRELCDDPLFERHGKIMVPTGMARQLIVPVQSALTLLERSLNQPYPAVSGRRARLRDRRHALRAGQARGAPRAGEVRRGDTDGDSPLRPCAQHTAASRATGGHGAARSPAGG
jgi:hypothetical protein